MPAGVGDKNVTFISSILSHPKCHFLREAFPDSPCSADEVRGSDYMLHSSWWHPFSGVGGPVTLFVPLDDAQKLRVPNSRL